MRIGILGSGLMGGKLGTLFARTGHEVVFSYARSQKKLETLAREAGGTARGRHAEGGSAGRGRDSAGGALVASGRRSGSGRRLVGKGDRHMLVADERGGYGARGRRHFVWRRGAREENAWCSSGLRVRHVPSEVLFPVFEARHSGSLPNLLYCGDEDEAKEVAAQLIRDVGFDPTDVGPLSSARYIEPFTMLVARLAYEGDDGPELAYRFEQFES